MTTTTRHSATLELSTCLNLETGGTPHPATIDGGCDSCNRLYVLVALHQVAQRRPTKSRKVTVTRSTTSAKRRGAGMSDDDDEHSVDGGADMSPHALEGGAKRRTMSSRKPKPKPKITMTRFKRPTSMKRRRGGADGDGHSVDGGTKRQHPRDNRAFFAVKVRFPAIVGTVVGHRSSSRSRATLATSSTRS